MNSNLPPGVTSNMIPGNGPQEVHAQLYMEKRVEDPAEFTVYLAWLADIPEDTVTIPKGIMDLGGVWEVFGDGFRDWLIQRGEEDYIWLQSRRLL